MKKENETIRVIRGFLRRFNEDHVGAYAAQSAYFILLSFIPFVLLLVTLVQYTPLTQEIVTTALVRIVPEEFSSFVEGVVREIFGKSPAYVPLSAVIALWSAGKGVNALTNGLNCVYRVEETRGYLINRLRSTGLYPDFCGGSGPDADSSGIRKPDTGGNRRKIPDDCESDFVYYWNENFYHSCVPGACVSADL